MCATRVELPQWQSLDLLERETVGRLCIIEQGYPLAFPVNYRLVRDGDRTALVFRVSPRAGLARYEGRASFEVDHIEMQYGTAWSVIVRGTVRRVLGRHELPDTHPFVDDDRQQWLLLDVSAISGRRFQSKPAGDGFVVEWQPADA